VEEWKSGKVEKWKSGKVEKWNGGRVEWWKGGMVEWWNGGKVEWWNGGLFEPQAPLAYAEFRSVRFVFDPANTRDDKHEPTELSPFDDTTCECRRGGLHRVNVPDPPLARNATDSKMSRRVFTPVDDILNRSQLCVRVSACGQI